MWVRYTVIFILIITSTVNAEQYDHTQDSNQTIDLALINNKQIEFNEAFLNDKFPINPSSTSDISLLKLYTVDLQYFRTEILEKYKALIIKKITLINLFQEISTKNFRQGSLSTDKYKEINNLVNHQMEAMSEEGILMNRYFLYLEKYRLKNRWALERIKFIQKSRFSF